MTRHKIDGLPGGKIVRQTKIIWLLKHDPPPTPLCFESREDWQGYLMLLHTEGRSVVRRQDRVIEGKRIVTNTWDRIDYCADCDIGGSYQQRMQRENRCILPAKNEKTATEAVSGGQEG